MANGALTRTAARILLPELALRGLDVLYDHGQTGIDPAGSLGKLRSWFSQEFRRATILADLDIAVVLRGTNQPIALIEIEETSSKPKLLLGDVMATLFGDHITFQRTKHLAIGPWTTLIVLAYSTTLTDHTRIAFLEKEVKLFKAQLTTPNAAVGQIVMDCFQSELELVQKLRWHVETAMISSAIVQRQE
jgi:hypothetical protein